MRAVWQEMLSTNANALLPLMPDDLLTSISEAGWRRGQTPAPLVCPQRFQWQGIENIMHVKRARLLSPPASATRQLSFPSPTLNTARRCQVSPRKAHVINRMLKWSLSVCTCVALQTRPHCWAAAPGNGAKYGDVPLFKCVPFDSASHKDLRRRIGTSLVDKPSDHQTPLAGN